MQIKNRTPTSQSDPNPFQGSPSSLDMMDIKVSPLIIPPPYFDLSSEFLQKIIFF